MKNRLVSVVLLLGLFSHTITNGESAKILAVFAFPGTSHFMMTNVIIKDLITRGHEVTMITGRSLAQLNLGKNYTEIVVKPTYNYWNDLQKLFPVKSIFELADASLPGFLKMVDLFGRQSTELALKMPEVQAIINAKKTEGVYDLLLVEQFAQEAFLALAYVYNIPTITLSTLGLLTHMSQMTGIILPWSYVPNGFLPYNDHMSFTERLINSFYNIYEDYLREVEFFPLHDELVEKYFKQTKVSIPKVSQMEKNLSLLLLNSYVPLQTSRPLSRNMIEIGGMHIYPPKPLASDMQKFIDEAEHGVIYLSLGSNLQSKDMPKDLTRWNILKKNLSVALESLMNNKLKKRIVG